MPKPSQIRKGDPSSTVAQKLALKALRSTSDGFDVVGAGYRTPGRPADAKDGAGYPDTDPKELAIKVEVSPGVFQIFHAELIEIAGALMYEDDDDSGRGVLSIHPFGDPYTMAVTR